MANKIIVTKEVKAKKTQIKVKKTFGDKVKIALWSAATVACPLAGIGLGSELRKQKDEADAIRTSMENEQEAQKVQEEAKANQSAATESTEPSEVTTTEETR